jgi:phospholipid/cholesterol/gamma-HCH transport system substrate-binding protein
VLINRRVRIQLVLFVLIALFGIAYIGASYVRLPQLLGIGVYRVDLDMPATGGVFANAEVGYRGYPVGRVSGIDLTSDGVVAHLLLDSGTPKIPASARVVVANRSAIGEQYVDLQPADGNPPYLADGSVLHVSVLPPEVAELIGSFDRFAHSVPLDALHTAVTELGAAFNGQGDNVETIITALRDFSQTWHDNVTPTVTLIHDGRVVLDTQAAQSDDIRAFSRGLDLLAAQLKTSDPDLNRLITNGTPASNQLRALVRESGPALTVDLTNLRPLATAIAPQSWALQPLLQQLPTLSLGTASTAPGDNTTHFGLVLEVNNPPPCTLGYQGTQRILAQMKARNPDFDDTRDDFPFNWDAECTVPQGSVSDVRGGLRAQFADPEVAQPWDSVPKTMPDVLNLNPVATQIATLVGIREK